MNVPKHPGYLYLNIFNVIIIIVDISLSIHCKDSCPNERVRSKHLVTEVNLEP